MIHDYHPNHAMNCPSDHTRHVLRITHPFSGVIHINEPCVANEYISLMARHLIHRELDFSLRVQLACDEAFDLLRRYYPPYPLQVYTLQQVIDSKPPSLRKRAIQAMESLRIADLHQKDYRIQMFIKNERMSMTSNDTYKPPRAIQARSTRYTIRLQRYIVPYSKKWRMMDEPPPILVGFNQVEIARILRDDWLSFDDPVAVLLDHKSFDSGVHTYWLKKEHQYYIEHYPNDPELPELLSVQLLNHGTTSNRIRYTVPGTRCSGDANTSSGNSTVNLAMLLRLFRDVDKRIRNIGDDSVVIISRATFNYLTRIGRFDELGVDYLWQTPYNVVDEFEHIEFCQCRPVETVNGWLMVRNPLRVLTRSSYCIQQDVKDLRMLKRWMKGVGDCEYAVNPGVPVLQQYALWLSSFTKEGAIYEPNYKEWLRRIPYNNHYINTTARLSFAKAFNISVDMQLFIEHFFKVAALGDSISDNRTPSQALLSVNDE